MPKLNMKDFLTDGAFLQTGPDMFSLLQGPFKPVHDLSEPRLAQSSLLFKTSFWSFLEHRENIALNSVFEPQSASCLSREEFIGLLASEPALKPEVTWQSPDVQDFAAQFEWSQDLFRTEVSQKTVPIICQSALGSICTENKVYILQQLLQNKNFGWSYGTLTANDCWIGHTPETLLTWNGREAETMALAGTYPQGPEAVHNILKDPKIRREHNYVIEDIAEKLRGTDLKLSETHALELKHLVHLKTDVSLPCTSLNQFIGLISRLHPTAAMGVFPDRIEQLRRMSEFALQKKRDSFAAPFGIIEASAAQIIVAIRNVYVQPEGLRIFSGCGVTAESIFDSEVSELENKRNSVKKMMGLI